MNKVVQIKEFTLPLFYKNPVVLVVCKNNNLRKTVIKKMVEAINPTRGTLLAPAEKYKPCLQHMEIFKNTTDYIYKEGKIKEPVYDGVCFDDVFVIDDGLPNFAIQKDDNIQRIMMNGRQYGVSSVFGHKTVPHYPPETRVNLDYVIFGSESFKKNREKIYEHYCDFIETYDEFEAIFKSLTDEDGLMIIDNKKKLVMWFRVVEESIGVAVECAVDDDLTVQDKLKIIDNIYDI